jgi:4-carboxymuconolactone decarboxylase
MNIAPVAETRQDRFDRGMEILARVDGEGGQRVVDALADINPELGQQVVAWAFGEITTANGVHINAALNVGLTPEEIVEALLHAAVYCGMPKSLNATFVAKKILGERGLLPVKTQ